jgi:uncharacterized protein (TIGR02118 family)
MSYQLTVLYHHPDDAQAFDRHYDGTHVPLAARIPGLRSYTVSRPVADPDGNRPAYHLVAVLTFDDEAAFGAGMGGPEGRAALADLPNFAGAGTSILTGPMTTVV